MRARRREAIVLNEPIGKLRGYDYPAPSIEGGQAQPPNHQTPNLLSREDVEKYRESLRDKAPVRRDRDR
jgi:hypothetical protein